LYLLYSILFAAFVVSAVVLRWSLRGLAIEPQVPEGAAAGVPVLVRVRLRNAGRLAARSLRVTLGAEEFRVDEIPPAAEAWGTVSACLPFRGWNVLPPVRVESSHPFGLLRASAVREDAAGLALPRGRRGAADAASQTASGEAAEGGSARRGGSDEISGVRPYDPSDGMSRIHWKATARMGQPFVAELSENRGRRVSVRVDAAASDAAVEAAAAACRAHIEAGAEVRLLSSEGDVDFGKGPAHLRVLLRALALLGAGKRPRGAPPPEAPSPTAPPPPRPEEVTAFHLASVVIAGSLFLIEDASPAVLAALLAALAAGALIDRYGGPRLPRRFWDWLCVLVLIFSTMFSWRLVGVTLANTYLVAYLLAHQSLNPKTRQALRESLLIGFLGFFLVSGQTISLAYFPVLLVFAGVYAHWCRLATGGAPLGSRALAGLTAACLALAGLAFAATPRFDPLRRMNPFVAMGLDTRSPRAEFVTGFSESVSLGFFGRIRKSSARVMRVRFPDWRAAAPPLPYLRLRGSAFDSFDGRNWHKERLDFPYLIGGRAYRSSGGKAWAPRRGQRFFFPGAERDHGPILEFTLYPLNSNVVFTYGGLRALQLQEGAAYFDYTDTVYLGSSYLGGTTYLAAGAPDAEGRGFLTGTPGYERFLSARFLQLPRNLDPRVRALALKVTRGSRGPLDSVRRIERHLRDSYGYSLYAEEANSTLQDFLFKTRTGNCEHFATSAAILLRAAGIPSRVVTGFLAMEWNEYGRFYDVRQSQAHAWAEAYIPEQGWITVEATPPGGESVVSSRFRRWLAALQTSWYRNIIGYDSYMQRNTFYRFRSALSMGALAERLGAAFRRARRAGGIAAALALVLAGAAEARRRARRAARRPPTAFETAAALLARRGMPREPDQTPREFAARAFSRRPELAALPELAELHYRARLRPGGLDPAARREAELLLEALREALAKPRA
ncbi:MAG TPA: transglutaminaseTgpA domain-containing protein, partial [Elusimicrobiota bacterium]|nr:transglutaminaseTgpA domain-containing protein [Elusimicrobiota bacterium]